MTVQSSVPSITKISWDSLYRIIASKYPPVDLFERIAPKEDWETLAHIESLTNPRIRDEIGEISLLPRDKRVSGPGATYVVSPFLHLNKQGSRFSDGTFGIYYGANDFQTALYEVAHHRCKFYRSTKEAVSDNPQFRVLKGAIDNSLHDITGSDWGKLHDPADYSASQPFGKHWQKNSSNGFLYNSVRNEGGKCVAAFWPTVVGIPIQTKHVQFSWNGTTIDQYFDYELDKWQKVKNF